MEPEEQPRYLTIREVCRLLRLSRSSVDNAIARGSIPVVRIGKMRRVDRHELEEALRHQQGR